MLDVHAVKIKDLEDDMKDHEVRIRTLEKLAWKLVGGVIVGTTIGTTAGGAIVAWLLR